MNLEWEISLVLDDLAAAENQICLTNRIRQIGFFEEIFGRHDVETSFLTA